MPTSHNSPNTHAADSASTPTTAASSSPAKRWSLNRRRFLQTSALASGALAAGGLTTRTAHAQEASAASNLGDTEIFQHSVASGDPLPNAVIIWTRVTPSPEATPGSGKGEDVQITWEISTTPEFTTITAHGDTVASASSDHTVKVDAQGLQPNTEYYYRFHARWGKDKATSRVGKTLTAPAGNATVDAVKFGVCSCSNYEAGYFRAYRAMADRDDLKFVLHLGDYIYEYATGEYTGTFGTKVRTVEPPNQTTTLTDYRIRQGFYHQDPDLADLHARKPMICIWDDHEFADNAWRDGSGGDSAKNITDYSATKAAATQAYYEWMPVRETRTNQGTHLYRTIGWGGLMEIILPDLRTYRDYELTQSDMAKTDPDFLRAAGRANRSMMGKTQFEWFAGVLSSSAKTWQIVGNEVMFAPMTLPTGLDPQAHAWLVGQVGLPDQGIPLNTDQWDGYMAERQKIIDLIADNNKKNVVFLTGDIHSGWANDIPKDAQGYRTGTNTQVVATEFVVPSVTANGMYDSIAKKREIEPVAREIATTGAEALKAVGPWFKWIDFIHHGYMAITITPESVRSDWQIVDNVLSPDTPFTNGPSFQARAGAPGVAPA